MRKRLKKKILKKWLKWFECQVHKAVFDYVRSSIDDDIKRAEAAGFINCGVEVEAGLVL